MSDDDRQDVAAGAGREPFSELCRKILLLVSDDAFALSHFRPLIKVLKEIAHEVVVVVRSTGRLGEIEAMGARVIDFDYRRPAGHAARGVASAWTLASILEAESPDVVHMVGTRPAVQGALALKLVREPRCVVHMTGLGALGIAQDRRGRLYRLAALRIIGSLLSRPSSYALAENPDDLALLRRDGGDPGARCAILGGVGVDPYAFPALPPPMHEVPVAAFVGRMTKTKGVDVLMQAAEQLQGAGVPLSLTLCGASDAEDADAVPGDEIDEACVRLGARWYRWAEDIGELWRRADIFVLPARGGEGLPLAMLEAAASARPLIVSDVPGCRHFVRDGIEGLIVPPGDATALAAALGRLAHNSELRLRMGEAARLRLLHGYTETQVQQSLRSAYRAMFASPG